MAMKAYQERVVMERTVLSEKIAALVLFMNSKQYQALPREEMLRLDIQKHAMIIYEDVLLQRIEAFPLQKETQQ